MFQPPLHECHSQGMRCDLPYLYLLPTRPRRLEHRWRDKGGVEDLRKARQYLDKLIELEGRT